MGGKFSNSACAGLRYGLVLGLVALGACAQNPSGSNDAKGSQPQKLVGIIQGDLDHARAVFEDPLTKKQRMYRVGEMVSGDTLTEIRRQEVMLKRGEEVVRVPLSKGSPDERRAQDSIPIPVAAGDPMQLRQAVISQVIAPYDPRVEKVKKDVSRKEVKRFVSYFQDQMKTQAPIWGTTSLGPVVDLNSVDTGLLDSLGLQSTDRIVEISGMGVDPDRFGKIMEILDGRRVTVFNMSVVRGDAVQPLYFGIKSNS